MFIKFPTSSQWDEDRKRVSSQQPYVSWKYSARRKYAGERQGRDLEAATADNARHLRHFERNEERKENEERKIEREEEGQTNGEQNKEKRKRRWIHLGMYTPP